MRAYVNHGRWVADCRTPHCNAAAFADDLTPCANCGVGTVAEFPHDRALIDAALSSRIAPETRNWSPGETVSDLLAENSAHEGVN